MLRKLWAAAAVAGALAGPALAGDDAVKLGRFQPDAAPAVGPNGEPGPASDTERTHWRGGWGYRPYWGGWGGYYGGYRSFYGGYPYWGGGWGGWGGGYYSYYRPGFAFSYYSAPSFYYPSFGYYGAGFFPISGGTGTPAVSLNLTFPPKATPASNSLPQPLPAQPATRPAPGTFQYDGGPSAPAPQPAPDVIPPAQPSTPAVEQSAMRIGRPAPAPAKPVYKYTAYGEKR